MKKDLLFLLIILFVLGGCDKSSGENDVSEMDPKDLPKVTAFQDDFTREFMAFTKEKADGYYLFQSKTGGYTMWYPEDAKMDKTFYQKTKNNFEAVELSGGKDKATGLPYYVRVIYDHKKDTKDIDTYLSLLSSSTGYEDDYKKMKYRNNTIYLGTMKNITKSNKEGKAMVIYSFLAFVKSNHNDQAVSYEYNILCRNNENDCSINLADAKKNVLELVKNIDFINKAK